MRHSQATDRRRRRAFGRKPVAPEVPIWCGRVVPVDLPVKRQRGPVA